MNNSFFVLDKVITSQFQESSTFSILQQNISEGNFQESQSPCLETAGEQLKLHINSNYGFSNIDEYNSHILPLKVSLETKHQSIIPSKGDLVFMIDK